MHIEFLVEEESAKEALAQILPKLLPEGVWWRVHPFHGKRDLLKHLPSRLKGYKHSLPEDGRIVVLLDNDEGDCLKLKAGLEIIARDAGINIRKGQPLRCVLNRIIIQELESWFFGDFNAITHAYPRVKPRTLQKERFRDPDSISGGVWEALEKVLQGSGYFRGGLSKTQAAREIAECMGPDRNTSHSFQVFRDGLISMLNC